MKIGIHKVHNKFPHILWRYICPVWLNCNTWKLGELKVYKWLWFYISFKTR